MSIHGSATRALLRQEALEDLLRHAGAGAPADVARILADALADHLRHDREQGLRDAREAYREGFFIGRCTPRIAPFSVQLWRASQTFRRLRGRDAATPESARYARFNEGF